MQRKSTKPSWFSNFKENKKAQKLLILQIPKEEAVRIISNPKGSRKEWDIERLAYYLKHNFSFFQNFTVAEEAMYSKFLQKIIIQTYPPSHILLDYGKFPDKFYIVFSGRVNIYTLDLKVVYKTEKEYCKYLSN
ncbi:MAG: hypothetical protein MJ252_08220, partial [archaeon]|nr:hypothetical protein [archaeon]